MLVHNHKGLKLGSSSQKKKKKKSDDLEVSGCFSTFVWSRF